MFSSDTSHIATWQPSAESWRASSRPIPVPPPVTTAMRPSNRSTSSPFVDWRERYPAVAPPLSSESQPGGGWGYRPSMALARPIQPIDVDDDALRQALEVADLPALLPALAMATGDLTLL